MIKNFYILYGLDKSLIKNELNKLIEQINTKDIITYDLNTISIEEIIDDASTISMFSSKKLIIVENSNFLCANKTLDCIEKLENYLTSYNSDTHIIFIVNKESIDARKKITKLIKEKGEIIELNKIDDNYLIDYITSILKQNEFKIEDINYFLNKTGKNLNNIKNELEKLLIYKTDTKTITNEDIDKISIKVLESEIFILSDAIIERNIPKSLELLNEFLNNSYDEMQIIMLLVSQFRFLFQVKRLINKNKNEEEIAKILDTKPYRIKLTKKKLYNYNEQTLLNYIKKLAKIDHDIKLGIMDKSLALELFIIES